MEIWKDIKGYEGLYQVSNKGRVKSLERVVMRNNGNPQTVKETILRPINNSRGHYHVRLQNNRKYEQFFIHQLVAQAFIPNPDPTKYTIVHHIDHNTQNNCVENLVWMTKEEHDELHKNTKTKKVYQYTLDGELIRMWESASYVEEVFGYSQAGISRCCNGGFYRKGKWINVTTANGYKWSYEPL